MSKMIDGITLRVLGDFGPFSRMGKSISYQITIGRSSYLIDCGAPIFQQIGGHGLKNINGLIITHCHGDHNRWFSDLALFNMYVPDITYKVYLITSEDIHNELIRASGPALDKSLSDDSKNIIDIAYEDYINYHIIGPRAKYKIVSLDKGRGRTAYAVTDRNNNIVDPDVAKIVISQKTNRPRLLFKDPSYGEWIEPESFYSFSSDVFYEKEKNIFKNSEGFAIEAIKAPVWHGIPAIGLKFTTDKETLIFSSDTVNDVTIWKELYTEKKTRQLKMPKKEFESAGVIYGDINEYIERVWSEERYREAINSFNDAIVIHDISILPDGFHGVHTDYSKLKNTLLEKERVILTHSPDRIVSEWALCDTEKHFRIKGKKYFEIVDGKLYSMNADIYCKEGGRYWVGYRNEKGKYTVYEKEGILSLSADGIPGPGTPLYRVDIYEDISGKYLPKLENKNAVYLKRKDGQVELVEFTEEGSMGTVIKDHRDKLLKK